MGMGMKQTKKRNQRLSRSPEPRQSPSPSPILLRKPGQETWGETFRRLKDSALKYGPALGAAAIGAYYLSQQ